jgi:hypothetical protein
MPLAILLAIVVVIVLIAFISSRRKNKLLHESVDWPTVEATIQSGSLELLADGRRQIERPCFIFSYVVSEEYYSGSFGLEVEGEAADSLIKVLIDRKVPVCYEPSKPSNFYLPGRIENYEILQELSGSRYYPKE